MTTRGAVTFDRLTRRFAVDGSASTIGSARNDRRFMVADSLHGGDYCDASRTPKIAPAAAPIDPPMTPALGPGASQPQRRSKEPPMTAPPKSPRTPSANPA